MAAAAPALFDAAALTAFFENAEAMALSNCTRLQLASEGILTPDNFKDFDDNGLEAIFLNLVKPPKVPGVGARLVEVLAFVFS